MSDVEQARKDPKFSASAVLVGLIVIAGIVLAGVYALGGADDTKGTGPEPTATASQGSSSACGLPDGAQSMPAAAPEAQWNLAGKAATPSSRSFGPAKVESGLHTCFAHNPSGAVFAAANYYADTTNPKISEALISSRLFEDANAGKAGAGATDDTDGPVYQISGFRVEDATRDRTTVALVVKSPDGPTAGQQAAITFTLGWQDGDWKIVVPASGQPPTTAIATLAGYTAWSGV